VLLRIAAKFAKLIVVVCIVAVLTFVMTRRLGGDPVVQRLGPQASNKVAYDATKHAMGLDRPFVNQLGDWSWNALHGDLGTTYQFNQPVKEALAERLPVTLELLVLAQIFSMLIAVPLGVICAYKQNSLFDRAVTGFSFALLSIPGFALAIPLIFFVAVKWQWVPAIGFKHLSDSVGDNLRSVALPATILILPLSAVYLRILRSDMIANLQEDFILMARAKGLPTRRILLRHALRPSSFSLLTVFGINFGALLGGSVIVEYLFGLPGVGVLAVEAIGRREYLLVQGVVLLIAVAFVCANFVVDLLYTVLDPRIRRAAS
jgi:peptide/nickel transport system permease protein